MNAPSEGHAAFAFAHDPLWVGVLVAIAVAAIWFGVVDVGRRAPTSPRLYLVALIGLRVLAGVLLLLVALQPTWTERSMTTVHGQVAVLVDRSRSMTVLSDGSARQEQAQRLVSRWAAENVPARWYGFGGELRDLDLADVASDTTLQESTSIGSAVEQVARSFGSELGAVVVISDGHETSEPLDVERIASLGVRVHTVAVGREADPNDEAIEEAQADVLAFVHRSANVRVKVRAERRAGQTLPVTLRRDDQVIADSVVTLGPDGRGEARLEFTPDRVGRALVQVQIPVTATDPVPENNERVLSVRVARDRTRVLLVSGRPGWDARALRGLLGADPAIDLITFFILRTPHDISLAPPSEMSLIPFPTDELFREHLHSFDVVLFQDFEYGPYEMARYLPGIAEYVRQGGAFAMIGGTQSFGGGGYARTAVADILPVTLSDGLDVVEDAFKPRVATTASEHPLVRLAPERNANQDLWSRAAPMLGFHRWAGVRPGAHVLLAHPSQKSGGAEAPVLVVGTASKGRVLALGVDSSWRWGMPSAGTSGDASLYERFWNRALRWLIRDPLLEPSTLACDPPSVAPRTSFTVSGQLRDSAYTPLSGTTALLTLRDAHEVVVDQKQVQTDHEGRVSFALTAPATLGGYRVTVNDGQQRAEASDVLIVERGGPELSDVTARPALLSRLSTQTDGTHVSIDKAPALSDLNRTRTRIAGMHSRTPFKQAWFVVLTVGVLALEWFVRRRAGLR